LPPLNLGVASSRDPLREMGDDSEGVGTLDESAVDANYYVTAKAVSR
jgi:hypothetical protein